MSHFSLNQGHMCAQMHPSAVNQVQLHKFQRVIALNRYQLLPPTDIWCLGIVLLHVTVNNLPATPIPLRAPLLTKDAHPLARKFFSSQTLRDLFLLHQAMPRYRIAPPHALHN